MLEVNGEKLQGATAETVANEAIKNLDFGKHETVKRLPEIIWALFNDCPELICYRDAWQEGWPKYDEDNTSVMALYKWLEGLGYQISEVERGLIQGTDVNYHLGDAEV